MKPTFRIVLVILLLFSSARAQFYFGQNKVQYTRFAWQVLTTEHFKIYYYDEEVEVAEIGARLAEEAYREFSNSFNLAIGHSIPLILYSSPNYFEQTNVIPDMIDEGTGGFTEFFKGRVVMPYTGSYTEFKKVLRHELIHVFTLEKISAVMRAHKKTRGPFAPLWFTEGIAEAWSRAEDDQARMVMVDLAVNNILVSVPNLYQISGSFMMYKEGESFLRFLSEKYGYDRLLEIFENWWRGESFEELVYLVYQKDLKKLGEEWEFSLKQRFYPQVKEREFPDRSSVLLSSGGLSVEPTPVHLTEGENRGDWVVYKANRLGYSGLYMVPMNGERNKKPVTLVKGERSRTFESLHLFRSGISANSKGEVAFVSKNNEKDRLYVYSVPKRKVIEEYDFPNLIGISSPAWSPDGSKLCFEGIEKSGFSDLYTVERTTRNLVRLTADIYEDRDPAFAADGSSILFASDRGQFGSEGYTNLYRMTLADRQVTPLTQGPQKDVYPSVAPDGKSILYASNRGEGTDIYVLDGGLRPHRISKLLTGVTHPKFSADGKKIIFSGFKNFNFQIYALNYPGLDSFPAEPVSTPALLAWSPEKLEGEKSKGKVKYKNDFSFDLAQSAVAYDAVYGPIGGMQTALTDVLGNKQYYFFLSNTARSRNSILSSFNVGVTYINKTHRINYGVGAYHFYDEYLDDIYGLFDERQAGGAVFASYPLSKFQRVEATGFLRFSRRNYTLLGSRRDATLFTGSLSWIKDNSIWELSGPIDGQRYNFTVSLSSDIKNLNLFYRSASGDLRKYFRLGRASAFAVRLAGFSSSGEEPQRVYLGGSWSLRGYSRRAFYGRHMVIASNELRFPLINRLVVGFPFGNIGMEGIRGALFFDAGNAWNEDFGRLKGALGIGARISLGYLAVLRFDWARRTDFKKIEPKTRFDFFFGWNF